jgi:hypothetical protein
VNTRKSLWLCLIWAINCTVRLAGAPGAAKYEPVAHKVATDWEMKVLLVLVIVLLAAATAFAYGADVTAGVSVVMAQTADVVVSEPTVLLISGGLLIALASAVRRLPI